MIICPTCQKRFEKEEDIAKHFLGCWKRQNPNHISKEAPRSENITKREIKSDISDFFMNLQNNARNKT